MRSVKMEKYELNDDIYLEKASYYEFIKYRKLYMDSMPIFQKISRERNIKISRDKDFYWIKKGERKIGGVKMKPNYISDLFLVPPNIDQFSILKLIYPLLFEWSDNQKDIKAEHIYKEQLEDFQKFGFLLEDATRTMIRPTEKFNLNWGIGLRLSQPDESIKEDIVDVFFQVFKDGIVKETKEDQRRRVEKYFEVTSELEILTRASTVVRDTDSNRIIGVCLVSLYEGLPLIYDLAVSSSARKKGLGSNMLKRAISVLEEEYSAVRLFVIPGNKAERLYYEMGFKTVNTRYNMTISSR